MVVRDQGALEAESIIKRLARDATGNIIETLRIVAHSQGLSIDEYDFAAYQQNLLSAIPGITTFQYDNNADKVVNGGISLLVVAANMLDI